MDYVREAGMWGYVIIALGLMALMESVLAAALSFGKPQPSVVALASAGTVACVLLFGVVGTLLGQQSVERALAFVGDQPGTVMAIRHQGYSEARHAAVLGLIFAAMPFLVSAAALLWRPGQPDAGSVAQAPEASVPPASPLRSMGLALLGLGALLAAGCGAMAMKPLPGRELSPEARQVMDEVAHAKRDMAGGCARLLGALEEWRGLAGQTAPLTAEQVRDIEESAPGAQRVAAKCVLSSSERLEPSSVGVRMLDPQAREQWEAQQRDSPGAR